MTEEQSPPVVFIGPSLDLVEARKSLDADYRQPIRRGDLGALEAGRVVAIIDGAFEGGESVTPRELAEAAGRGLKIVGCAGVGAMRAVDVPHALMGYGKIHEMFASGQIVDEDEIVRGQEAASVALVNIRFAVERLVKRQYLSSDRAVTIVDTARGLHYSERTYDTILTAAGYSDNAERDRLTGMLAGVDLMRNDALLVLEGLAVGEVQSALEEFSKEAITPEVRHSADTGVSADSASARPDGSELWETGDLVTPDAFLRWIVLSGRFPEIVETLQFYDDDASEVAPGTIDPDAPSRVLSSLRFSLGWVSVEETQVALSDIGLTLDDISDELGVIEAARCTAAAWVEPGEDTFWRHTVNYLLRGGVDLKRELVRAGCYSFFEAAVADRNPRPDDVELVTQRILQRFNRGSWEGARREVELAGLSPDMLDALRNTLASSRDYLRGDDNLVEFRPERLESLIDPTPKHPGSSRFELSLEEARRRAESLCEALKISRVGFIERFVPGLAKAVHVTQAYSQNYEYASSVTSGKSLSKDGAYVGAIMEAVETYSYSAFDNSTLHIASERELKQQGRPVVSTRDLSIPYDSRWREDTPIAWLEAVDLVGGETHWVSASAFLKDGTSHDPWYSKRAGMRVWSTNGGASGFSLAGAAAHALWELLERHNCHCWDTLHRNPGLSGARPFRRVDPKSFSESVSLAVAELEASGRRVVVVDSAVDIPIPTFQVFLIEAHSSQVDSYGDGYRFAEGSAAHLDPSVAMTSALCEAAQTLAAQTAGSAEDLTITERSLGRSERAALWGREFLAGLLDPAPMELAASALPHSGASLSDVRDELAATLAVLGEMGLRALMYDFSSDALAGAHMVRFVVPGTGGPLPYCFPARVRRFALADFLGPDTAYASHIAAALPRSRLPG